MDILYHVSKMRYPRAKLFNDDYTVLDDSLKIGQREKIVITFDDKRPTMKRSKVNSN